MLFTYTIRPEHAVTCQCRLSLYLVDMCCCRISFFYIFWILEVLLYNEAGTEVKKSRVRRRRDHLSTQQFGNVHSVWEWKSITKNPTCKWGQRRHPGSCPALISPLWFWESNNSSLWLLYTMGSHTGSLQANVPATVAVKTHIYSLPSWKSPRS